MPEIKHNFFQGKMNKDLDERLVPNGQYRDALNINISTSDNDDIGTAQNIKGNTLVDNSLATGSSVVGSIADEKNNALYWFVSGPETTLDFFTSSSTQPTVNKDLILEYKNTTSTPVFVDVYAVYFTMEQGATDVTFNTANKSITVPSSNLITNVSKGMFLRVEDKGTPGGTIISNNKITDITGTTITFENNIDALSSVSSSSNCVFYFSMPDNKRVLNFNSSYKVTGINIIDDLLFWTDNNSEPKKINITRSKLGTTDINTHTSLYVSNLNTDAGKIQEENITVIKKAPLEAPIIELFTLRQNIFNFSTTKDFTSFSSNENERDVTIIITPTNSHGFKPNDILTLEDAADSTKKVILRVKNVNGDNVDCIVENKSGTISGSSTYNITFEDNKKSLFENKFSSFAVRWKYADGEYSTFSPFTQTAFLPNEFSYDTKEAYNKGMENNLKEVIIKDFIPYNIPSDVVQIDILYKESDSPVIYSIDSIKKEDENSSTTNSWNTFNGSNHARGLYKITSDNIYAALPSNQLLRVFDTVPRKALAQDTVSNRIIYGNYLQNFDLIEDTTTNKVVKPIFSSYVDKRLYLGGQLLNNRFLTNNTKYWTFDSSWSRNINDNKIEISSSSYVQGHKFAQRVGESQTTGGFTSAVLDNKSYEIKFSISNFSGASGELRVALKGSSKMSEDNLTFNADGDYKIQATIDKNTRNIFGAVPNANSIIFYAQSPSAFTCSIDNFSLKEIIDIDDKKSIKSQRDYQLGVVYSDEYGRQTPVLTDKTASLKISKNDCVNSNQFISKLTNTPPHWAKHFKYYIKETSSEYNNLALDRVYKAEDSNVWLSFPSSERNKVDIEDYLILKKAHDSVSAVTDENAKYKIIAIENEAPEFIKRNLTKLGETSLLTSLFTDTSRLPVSSGNSIAINKSVWDASHLDISSVTDKLALQFRTSSINSKVYNVDTFSVIDIGGIDYYQFILNDNFLESDVDFIMATSTTFNSGVLFAIFDIEIQNRSEFEGRFFVKIINDNIIQENIYNNSSSTTQVSVSIQKAYFYLQDNASHGAQGGTTYAAQVAGTSLFADNQECYFEHQTSTNSRPFRFSGGSTGTAYNAIKFKPSNMYIRGGQSLTSSYSVDYGLLAFFNNQNLAFFGSKDAEEKFKKIIPTSWFIDNVSYVGTQPLNSQAPSSGSYPQTYNWNHEINNGKIVLEKTAVLDSSSQKSTDLNSFGYQIGRGIFTATSKHQVDDQFFIPGKHYIEISFNGFTLDFPSAAYNASSAGWNNAWDLPSAQNSFIQNLFQGSKFKFANDAQEEIYTIEAVKIERRYNHTPQPANNRLVFKSLNGNAMGGTVNVDVDWATATSSVASYQIVTVGGGITTLGVAGGSTAASTVNSVWTEEKTRFGKASNRRLTYILQVDKLPGANGTANPLLNITTSVSSQIQFVVTNINEKDQISTRNPAIFETEPKERTDLDIYYAASDYYDIEEHGAEQSLPWSNCISFGNGVESNRIKDTFNKVTIGKGAIASTTVEEQYKENRRSSGLIFSGLYNATTSLNNLNQFIQAENITKDINPSYGSIQKLFARNSDLVVLCEDKIIKVLSSKDAIFNADGNSQLIANENVLGQSIPFVGDYGISKNPESFAKENYRAYFSDQQRKAILRLSMDGLTAISDAGMSDWFSDNMVNADSIIGTYNSDKSEYNVTLIDNDQSDNNYTVSFSEKVKGWTSFKSFIPEDGLYLNNVYYTFKQGELYSHGTNSTRNTFYSSSYRYRSTSGSNFEASSITVLLNDAPSSIKNFKALSYEGSQGKIPQFTSSSVNRYTTDGTTESVSFSDNQYYNLNSEIKGWSVESINTENQQGALDEFIEKENIWYNYIKGITTTASNIDESEFSVQGLGTISSISYTS